MARARVPLLMMSRATSGSRTTCWTPLVSIIHTFFTVVVVGDDTATDFFVFLKQKHFPMVFMPQEQLNCTQFENNILL